MQKISIKREQSQAGLSFAEREKFRPQVKNKLLLLLALLLTAATGAWAQGGGDAAKYTKAVAISELKVGDILAQGASITGESSDAVKLDPNRSKVGNDVVGTEVGLNLTVSFGTNGTINNQYAPVTESGQDGDAWVVTNVKNQFGIYTVNLAGILMTGGTEPVATTYTVSLKDNVKDADKWTVKVGDGLAQALPIGGLTGDGSETVTLQYTGRLKVKGVKATSEAAAEESDLLAGVFSVSSTNKVNFSKGNLQATYNGTDWTWAFAENQWDYIGNAAGNTSINGNGTVSASNVTVDLFGWVGASSTWTGAAQYGISNSTATDNTDGYGNAAREALKSDWGNTIGTDWRTLTSDEWQYLFKTRTTGGTVFGTEQARYAQATINTDGTSVKGMILFPDGVSIASTEVTTAGSVNATSAYATKCTTAQWAALAAKGCVFLPAAGNRNQASVYSAGSGGYYWSSSHYTSNSYYAYRVIFLSGNLSLTTQTSRYLGYSVRLVQEVAPNP